MLGLDPAAIRSAGKLSEDDLLTAGYRSADENLFIDRGLKTPWTWDENGTARMLSLYKGFQFREGKLIKDSIKRGMAGGPVSAAKTLAILGTVFPIAGYIVSSMENVATGRSPLDRSHIFKPRPFGVGNEYTDQVLDAYSHVAAFGIWYSLYRATAFRRGSDYTEGPVWSLGADALYGGYQASQGKYKSGIKSITRRVPVVGPAIAAHVDDISGVVSDTYDSLIP